MQTARNAAATAKEKVSNMATSAKEGLDKTKAAAQQKKEKSSARNKAEKEVAHERKEAKDAEAEMNAHAARAHHKAEKEDTKYGHLHGDLGTTEYPTHSSTGIGTAPTPLTAHGHTEHTAIGTAPNPLATDGRTSDYTGHLDTTHSPLIHHSGYTNPSTP